MPVYEGALIQREEIAAGTMAFHFQKPQGFEFKAGQAIDLTLIDPPENDAEGLTRAFRRLLGFAKDPVLFIRQTPIRR